MATSAERDNGLCCCNSEDTINQVPQKAVLISLITGLLHRQWSQSALTLAMFTGRISSTSPHATLEPPVHIVYVCILFILSQNTTYQLYHHDDKKKISKNDICDL